MPTLSLFAAANHVLLDPISDQLSLIGIAHRVTGSGQVIHADGDSDAVAASKFTLPQLCLTAFWIPSPQDMGQQFEQYISIVAPDQKETVVTPVLPFTITRDFHRTVQPAVIACRTEGLFRLVLRLRKSGDEWPQEPQGGFSFHVLEPETPETLVDLTRVDPAKAPRLPQPKEPPLLQ